MINAKTTVRIWMENREDMLKKLNYKLPFHWHFFGRHVFDEHKNIRHTLPSIEDTWITDQWECRVFALFLAISEVNAFLILG